MLLFLLSVIGISLSGVLMPGPTFAVTVVKGYRSPLAGTLVALGHAAVELPLILAIYFGLVTFLVLETVRIAVGLAGGAGLVYLGVSMFRARAQTADQGKDLPYGPVVAGIATTALNPYFLVWWATIGAALVVTAAGFGTRGIVLFAMAHLFCDFAWLSLVSAAVNRTGRVWNPRIRVAVFSLRSFILVGFGIWFMASTIPLM